MIVVNPPRPPAHLKLVTGTDEERAVETALRIARVPFECAETYPSLVDFADYVYRHGEPVTFIAQVPEDITIYVVPADQVAGTDRAQHRIVDGAQGVLELAAMLASLIGPRAP